MRWTDNPRMTELLIVRHGETDWNRQHRFQGQIDVPLHATGEQQARRLVAQSTKAGDAVLSTQVLIELFNTLNGPGHPMGTEKCL